jgi:hexosaminidase
MKHYFFSLIFFTLITMHSMYAQSYETKLIPFPQKLNLKAERFPVTNTFTLSIIGAPDARIYAASNRFLHRLDGRTGLFLSQPVITNTDNNPNASLIIKITRPGIIKLNEDESYGIQASVNQILLTAETDLGAMHGLETILQLLSSENGSYFFPVCEIQDAPRFAWRGLMIDVGRHFIPLEVILRNIDAMAAVKLNVLHLHLTEDQGFRIESKVFPELHQMGSDGQYFTQNQIKEIIQYANDHGIRVVPEFDMPGHATSWFLGHPELASAPGPYSIERKLGVFDPTIDPTRESTYEFLDKFLGEMAQLFNDEYLHIGGDENNGKQWNNNADIQLFMKNNNLANNHALQAYFNRRLLTILNKYNKKMIGWDEIMQPELPKTAVIQSWRGKEGLTAAAKAGYQVLLSNGYYIDLMQPAKDHYLNDPLPSGISLSDDQKKLILGGEATMWSELVTWETIDSRIWPRTAAIAERLWSPANIVNIEQMYKKLETISIQLEELGLTHRKNTDMLLRRLCQDNDIVPLRTLVNIVEPVKFYERAGSREVAYRSFSPYTRMVDAAQADAPEAMLFNSLVEKYLMSKEKIDFDKLNNTLNIWLSLSGSLQPILDKNPVLKEINPIVSDVSKCSQLGLDALKYLKKKKKPSKSWIDSSAEIIKSAKIHKAQLELKIVPGIEKLVEYAAK